MNETRLKCPNCGTEIDVMQSEPESTLKCTSCRVWITLPLVQNPKDPELAQSVATSPDKTRTRNPSKAALWMLLLVGFLVHILFSAEGIFYRWNWEHPDLVIANMVGSGTARILGSLVFILPVLHYLSSKPRPKNPKMQHVVWSVYLGFAVSVIWRVFYLPWRCSNIGLECASSYEYPK